MSDLILVGAFPNEPEAQVAAAALRAAQLHPVVLGHDPLAQLLDPARAARILVPADEYAAARELLGLAEPEQGSRTAARPVEPYLVAVASFVFLATAYTAPRLLPLLVPAAGGFWYLLRRARSRALEP